MEIDEAIRHALDGHAILFVGAGFSRDAKSKVSNFILTGESLAAYFKEKLQLTESVPLDVLADMYKDKFSEFELGHRLIKAHPNSD
jgi:hypothetical protein